MLSDVYALGVILYELLAGERPYDVTRSALAEARRIFEAVLGEQRRILGPEHTDTMATMSSLAMLYSDQGNPEAERLMLELLETAQRAWGDEHPETLATMYGLADLSMQAGRTVDAERLFLDVIERQKRVLGPDHRQTLRSEIVLAKLYEQMDRHPEAERLYVDTANTLHNLACVYRDSGRWGEARALFEEVRAIHEAAWGPDHRWGAGNLEDSAALLRMTGDDERAAELEARVSSLGTRSE